MHGRRLQAGDLAGHSRFFAVLARSPIGTTSLTSFSRNASSAVMRFPISISSTALPTEGDGAASGCPPNPGIRPIVTSVSPESGVLGHDSDITARAISNPPPEHVPVDSGDQGLPYVETTHKSALAEKRGGRQPDGTLQIHSGAKRLVSGASDDSDTQPRVITEVANRRSAPSAFRGSTR